mgnify:CR=1 FL=1
MHTCGEYAGDWAKSYTRFHWSGDLLHMFSLEWRFVTHVLIGVEIYRDI